MNDGDLSKFLNKPELQRIWELHMASALEKDRRGFWIDCFEALAKSFSGK